MSAMLESIENNDVQNLIVCEEVSRNFRTEIPNIVFELLAAKYPTSL